MVRTPGFEPGRLASEASDLPVNLYPNSNLRIPSVIRWDYGIGSMVNIFLDNDCIYKFLLMGFVIACANAILPAGELINFAIYCDFLNLINSSSVVISPSEEITK